MDTDTVEVGEDWELLVDDGDDFFASLPFESSIPIYLAVKAAVEEPAEGVYGHRIGTSAVDSYNREIVGPGNVYFRTMFGHTGETVKMSLTTWTP